MLPNLRRICSHRGTISRKLPLYLSEAVLGSVSIFCPLLESKRTRCDPFRSSRYDSCSGPSRCPLLLDRVGSGRPGVANRRSRSFCRCVLRGCWERWRSLKFNHSSEKTIEKHFRYFYLRVLSLFHAWQVIGQITLPKRCCSAILT